MICKNCGATIEEGANYCTQCGAGVNPTNAGPASGADCVSTK